MKLKIVCIFFIISTACKSTTSELPILSYNYIDGKKELYKIDGFEFINQDGDTISSTNTEGKIHTMNFFFTTCPSICPPMRIKQSEIAKTFSSYPSFRQYSISIDFKRDTLAQLQYYSKLHDINSEQWQLLRAPSEAQLNAIATLLKSNFEPNEDGTDFYHSSYLALIDNHQHIRGFYDILKDEEIVLLKKDITVLLNQLE
ncbi:SCO family protein [uncultured Psychroserpens sp.]|uniref:SCO family protein n=1 Tax=uncultured Psychroserpens sp. TaxID=255436 RepID=UPI00261D9050|nr:SCO family protein [uncultured Psychroserpens sp.]